MAKTGHHRNIAERASNIAGGCDAIENKLWKGVWRSGGGIVQVPAEGQEILFVFVVF